jgi:phage tail sheath protein FI
MPITPTYPGIYIEELPSSAHTIAAAPTSVAVFVGYTHPFKTKNFNRAVQLFSFTDYEREFGGLYVSGLVDSSVAYAVEQFFLNGGSVAYVIGLQAQYFPGPAAITAPTVTAPTTGGGIVFNATEPTDRLPMTVTVNNLKASNPAPGSPKDTADILVTYGTRVETFRGVSLNSAAANFIEKVVGTAGTPVSSLVSVAPSGGNYGTDFGTQGQYTPPMTPPPGFTTTFSESDFVNVFQLDSALDKIDIFNLLVIPGVADNSIWSAALSFCERKQAFVIMDPPRQAAADPTSAPLPLIADEMNSGVIPKSTNGALYFPYLLSTDPLTGNVIELPPSGFVAGVYARTDTNRGVWKAPAGLETVVSNTTGVVQRGRMTDMRQGTLNPIGVNCLRTFQGVGTVVFGARTVVSGNTALQQWWYVPVRRMALFLEQTLYRNLGWVVFEPNDEPLWIAIRTSIENFMLSLFRQGAFQGTKPSQAFQVKCDSSTTTQDDIDNGIVNIIVAFAPLKPAEFVIIKIAQLAGQVQS